MAFVVPPGSVVPGSGTVLGHSGSYCPTSWEENFDRAQMSTEVLIGHATPSNVPTFRYNFPGSLTTPPPSATITLNGTQQGATVMHVHKVDANGNDNTVWLRYVQQNCSVSITSVGRATADDNNKTRGYRVTGTPTEATNHFDIPIFWDQGTDAIAPGFVTLALNIVAETPKRFVETGDFGTNHYGRLTFTRTDLIRTDPIAAPIYETLADRILEIRGSNSVPRIEAVTIDARTSPWWDPTWNMQLMSSASPEKPSRYQCCLQVDGRLIFSRICFASAVRHFIARDEWTLRITLDVAEWAGTL